MSSEEYDEATDESDDDAEIDTKEKSETELRVHAELDKQLRSERDIYIASIRSQFKKKKGKSRVSCVRSESTRAIVNYWTTAKMNTANATNMLRPVQNNAK